MTRSKLRWKDLSPAARGRIVLFGLLQVSLQVAALRDLAKRPADQVRGPKVAWVAASFINFAGPVAYFAKGRRRA
ncbi:PLDc N-terminal domain-containing protein [Specibacter cremeus]|uniref:PLDc N-terminal domain-containing protein n=1 Tax=Specibacter cremeus TaxID=1629051 RepID=UPI000F79C2FB|nr:PLDc N-terminal domain-containing protein [Specibacter cremeus]